MVTQAPVPGFTVSCPRFMQCPPVIKPLGGLTDRFFRELFRMIFDAFGG
jgi:hypothetical protein